MVDLTTPPPSAPATGANQAPTPSPVINSTSVVRRKPYIDVNSDDELTPPPNDRASRADFPDDHWQEPNSDDLMPPAREDVKPRDSTPPTDPPAVIVPPAPLPTVAPPALPLPITAPLAIATPSNDHRHSEGQHAVTMQDLEAEINNIRREMEAIRVQHRDEHTRIEARLTQQARVNARLQHGVDSQWALLKTMNVQIEAMLTFSRASRGANNPITPPPFDPNPVFTRPPTFDMAESISPFARRFTNDVFPVTRQVPVESPVTPTRVPAASGAPAPMLAGTSNGPVRAQDKGNM